MKSLVGILCLFVIAIAYGKEKESTSQTLRLASDIVLENLSGRLVRDVILDLRLVEDLPSKQRLEKVALQGGDANIMHEAGYAKLRIGDMAMGERRALTFLQEVGVEHSLVSMSTSVKGSVSYGGYRTRVSQSQTSGGDCTELALQEIRQLQQQGRAAQLVAGVVLSRDSGGGHFVNLHDWVAVEDEPAQGWLDPSAWLLPGTGHRYIAFYVQDYQAQRLPLYRVNKQGIGVTLSLRRAH